MEIYLLLEYRNHDCIPRSILPLGEHTQVPSVDPCNLALHFSLPGSRRQGLADLQKLILRTTQNSTGSSEQQGREQGCLDILFLIMKPVKALAFHDRLITWLTHSELSAQISWGFLYQMFFNLSYEFCTCVSLYLPFKTSFY